MNIVVIEQDSYPTVEAFAFWNRAKIVLGQDGNIFHRIGTSGPPSNWSGDVLNGIASMNEPFMLLLIDYLLVEANKPLLNRAWWKINDPLVADIGMVRLLPCPGPTRPFLLTEFGLFDKSQPYSISFQAAFWKPQVLRDLLVKGEDAWDAEFNGSKRAASYDEYRFIGTKENAISYKNLFRRGERQEDAWRWYNDSL